MILRKSLVGVASAAALTLSGTGTVAASTSPAAVHLAGVSASRSSLHGQPPGPAVITGQGHGVRLLRTEPLPPGLHAQPGPDYLTNNNPIWAGWADDAYTNVELRYVSADFIVPTVHCFSPNDADIFWVGLDGDREGSTVEQVGVAVYCDSQSNPVYLSWWEMYPNLDHLGGSVSPGDAVTASVYCCNSAGQYNLFFEDDYHPNANINKDAGCPAPNICHNATAEVIAEDPSGGPPNQALAQFTPVTFYSVAVTSRDGTHGTLEANNLWNADDEIMQYQGYPMASPGDRVNGYTQFTDYWQGGG